PSPNCASLFATTTTRHATTSVFVSHVTWRNEMRMQLLPLFPGLVLLLALSPPAFGAEPEPQDSESESQMSESEQEAAMAAEIAAAEAASEEQEDSAAPPEALLDENFVPSIQISEDLSVSFPVDI